MRQSSWNLAPTKEFVIFLSALNANNWNSFRSDQRYQSRELITCGGMITKRMAMESFDEIIGVEMTQGFNFEIPFEAEFNFIWILFGVKLFLSFPTLFSKVCCKVLRHFSIVITKILLDFLLSKEALEVNEKVISGSFVPFAISLHSSQRRTTKLWAKIRNNLLRFCDEEWRQES